MNQPDKNPLATVVSIMFTLPNPDRAERVEDGVMSLLEAIPDVTDAGSTSDVKGADPLTRTQDLARSALAALSDLEDGQPWKEMHVDVARLLREAEELDCAPGDAGFPPEVEEAASPGPTPTEWYVRSSNGDLTITPHGTVTAGADEWPASSRPIAFDVAEFREWARSTGHPDDFAVDGETDILLLGGWYQRAKGVEYIGADDDFRAEQAAPYAR